jgi:hypothetical protein
MNQEKSSKKCKRFEIVIEVGMGQHSWIVRNSILRRKRM